MQAIDSLDTSPEPTPEQLRLRRERRMLVLVLALLLVTTALASPLSFHSLPLLLLLVTPFAMSLILTVVIAPLGVSAAAAQAERQQQQARQNARETAAAQHAIRTPPRNTLPRDEPAALAAAVAAAEEHGIRFGCTHLSDEDFLQTFHASEIRPADFHHGDHLRYTVLMQQRVPAGLVEATIARNLRTFLREVCGSEALFHATRTHAWVALLAALPPGSFAHLLQQHAAGLRGESLGRFYSNELLLSDDARQRSLPPDRDPLPPPYAPMRSSTTPAMAPPTSGPRMGTHA